MVLVMSSQKQNQKQNHVENDAVLPPEEHELVVELRPKHIDSARGLDKGKCPLGVFLMEYDPNSKWTVEPQHVCRYSQRGNFVYKLPFVAVEMLAKWDLWFLEWQLGLTDDKFPVRELDFVLEPEEYPDEHLVPEYKFQPAF